MLLGGGWDAGWLRRGRALGVAEEGRAACAGCDACGLVRARAVAGVPAAAGCCAKEGGGWWRGDAVTAVEAIANGMLAGVGGGGLRSVVGPAEGFDGVADLDIGDEIRGIGCNCECGCGR